MASRNLTVILGMHPRFTRQGLASFFEHAANGFEADGVHDLLLHHLFHQQSDRPAFPPRWRIAASNRNQLDSLLGIQ